MDASGFQQHKKNKDLVLAYKGGCKGEKKARNTRRNVLKGGNEEATGQRDGNGCRKITRDGKMVARDHQFAYSDRLAQR